MYNENFFFRAYHWKLKAEFHNRSKFLFYLTCITGKANIHVYENLSQLHLSPNRKYQPRIHVVEETEEGVKVSCATYVFPETAFIAVTTYQNEEVSCSSSSVRSELKITCSDGVALNLLADALGWALLKIYLFNVTLLTSIACQIVIQKASFNAFINLFNQTLPLFSHNN